MEYPFIQFLKKYREIIDYIIAGGLTTAVGMFLFYVGIWTFLDGTSVVQLQIANMISWCGSVIFAYILNRVMVFKSRDSRILSELLSFAASRVLTLLLDMAIMFIGASMIGIHYNIVKVLSMFLVTIANYGVSKFFVFKSREKK